MAQRKRRKSRPRRTAAGAASVAPAEPKPPSRSAQRDAAARAALEPIAPGERPAVIVIATVVAVGLGVANLVAFALGVKIQGKSAGPSVLLFPAVMAIAAVGMWRLRYWAVLGFEALLALIVIVFSLFLVRAGNVEAVVISLAIIGSGGWLFFKLVRAMARIQMPSRERR